MLAVFVAFLAVAAGGGPGRAGAAGPAAQASVVNGVEATAGSYPYLAFVYVENGGEAHACTGTVVSADVVLTAAHCALDDRLSALDPPSAYAVVTGDVDWTAGDRTVSAVSRVAVDPDFAYLAAGEVPVRADAALLALSRPVSAPSVRLATSRSWSPGDRAVIAGWGLTDPTEPAPTGLHVGEMTLQTSAYCGSEFAHFQPAWQLCTLDYPEYEYTTCNGDSGGPLLAAAPGAAGEPQEIAITSSGDLGCPTEAPAYFTRVDAVAAWVQQKIAEWAQPPEPAPQPMTAQSPTLGGTHAGGLARRALRTQLRGRFRGHRALRVRCSRVARTRQRCAVGWWVGDREYRGRLTVYYFLAGGEAAWNDRYRIRQVSRRCRLRSRHPGACPAITYRR